MAASMKNIDKDPFLKGYHRRVYTEHKVFREHILEGM